MTDWKHELGQEYLALLEGGELGREAYRAGQIAKAEELGRMDARATQGTASLYEQVQHALFGARFWVSRARIKKAMHPIELMSTMLEHHHGGDSERAVSGWHQAIRAAASAGQIIPRDAVSLMPLPVLPVGDDWLLTLPDADKFLEPLGWAVSDYLVHVFDDCFPTAAPAQTATPAPVVAASDALAIPKNQRPDLLAPLIEKAQRGESDPFNAAVIWLKLCDMAEQKLKPFIGKTGDGLQWIDAFDDPQFMSKNALSDRLRRAKKAAIELAKPR